MFTILFSSINAQNFNRPIPSNHTSYEFNQVGINNNFHYLMTPFSTTNSPSTNIGNLSLLNKNGYIDWYLAKPQKFFFDFNYHPQHQLFSYTQSGGALSNAKFFILDTTFNYVDSISPVNGVTTDIHGFQILANGNYVISGFKDSILDLSAFVFQGTQGSDTTHIKAFVIQEFDNNHNLVFEWNSNDHIHPSEFIDGYGYDSTNFDYCHGNAIDEDLDGNYLVSLRHLDAIYKINKATGNTMWILGGKSNQFTFTNDSGFNGQHDIRILPHGNITLFDNGNFTTAPIMSRPVEYTLDTVTMTCTKVWDYIYSPSFFTKAMGSHQTITNNQKVIGYGFLNRPNPSFIHLDEFDNIVTEVFLKDSIVTYRAFAQELQFNLNNPVIACSGNGTTATLTAPSGFNNYEWSTGETSQSIIVSDTGSYQVWVNYGIGMLGSEPLIITDMQNPCNAVGINDVNQQENSNEIIFVFDLVGRQISQPKAAQIYVVKYKDGRSELIQWKKSFKIND